MENLIQRFVEKWTELAFKVTIVNFQISFGRNVGSAISS